MDGIVAGVLLLLLSAHGALWYKIGKLEQVIKNHLSQHPKE